MSRIRAPVASLVGGFPLINRSVEQGPIRTEHREEGEHVTQHRGTAPSGIVLSFSCFASIASATAVAGGVGGVCVSGLGFANTVGFTRGFRVRVKGLTLPPPLLPPPPSSLTVATVVAKKVGDTST